MLVGRASRLAVATLNEIMTKPLPRPPRHLHVFGVSLLLIVAALLFVLFGVKMEASVPATGLVNSPTADGEPSEFSPIRLTFEERNFGPVAVGQEVRISSAMYPQRTHGVAKGVIDRLEMIGTEGPNGSRVFHAWAKVIDSPFPLLVGSSVRAEVVTGRKPTYQIILEH